LIASRSGHVKFLPNEGGPLVSEDIRTSIYLIFPNEETHPRRPDITEQPIVKSTVRER
jgi:hypothetical protein